MTTRFGSVPGATGRAPIRGINLQRNNNNHGSVPNNFGVQPTRSSSNTSATLSDEESKRPTMDEVIAMALCYRRLAFVLGAAPVLVAVTPVIVKLLLAVVNFVTKGYGNASLVLTALLTWIWYTSLKKAAPSPEKLQDAYRKSHGRLPLFMFVGSCIFLRLMANFAHDGDSSGGGGGGDSADGNMLQWTPDIAFDMGFRPAFGLTLVGLIVLLRLVGRSSVVRCSTMPLVSNQETFLSFLAGPENGAGDTSLNYSDFRLHNYNYGWRYQWPSSMSGLANLVVIVFLGYITAETVFVPYWHYLESSDTIYEHTRRSHSLVLCSCILPIILHFGFSNLNGSAHELNPKKYYTNDKVATPVMISAKAFLAIVSRTFGCAIFVPCVSFLPISFITKLFIGLEVAYEKNMLVTLFLFCCGTSAVVGFYAAVLDEASKTILCTPGMNLERVVRDANVGQAPGGRESGATESTLAEAEIEAYVVDTMLHSILHGDFESVSEIRTSTATKTNNCPDPARFEAARNTNAVNRMSKVLLGSNDAKRSALRPERPLEEDILRHSILESIGGSISPPLAFNGSKTNNSAIVVAQTVQEYKPSERHMETLRYWVLPSRHPQMMNTQGTSEPKGVVLIRALCAYTGGLGQSLMEASKMRSSNTIVWTLPPGAIVGSEYAVIATSRCLVTHLQHIKHDWRSSHISMLVAAALSSAYRLRMGIFEYARYRKNLKTSQFHPSNNGTVQSGVNGSVAMDEDISEHLVKNHPELRQLLSAIDEAIDGILNQLEATTGNSSSFELVANALENSCALWIRVRRSKTN